MATGVVVYWNGKSGWIEQDGAENFPTVQSSNVMLLLEMVDSGTIKVGAAVTFELDKQMWIARHVTVDKRGEPDKPPPVIEPEPPPIGDSPDAPGY